MKNLDAVLEKISMVFGTNSLEVVIPDDLFINLSLINISAIDKNDLESEAVYQPKIHMLFLSMLSYVTDKYNRYEALSKQLESSLFMHYEKQLIDANERATDKKLAQMVASDEQMLDAINNKLNYKNMMTTFSNVVEGLSVRRDCLLQLISKRKREMMERVA